jgi:hypothetical protein
MPENKIAARTQKLTLVKTVKDVQFLGVNGSQLSVGQGLILERNQDGVKVSHPGHPGKTYVVFAANIAHLQYEEQE